ncbi:chaperonin 10-like protein [Xylogone sp. PMI_703]|nr:chaperonin 10-like protein [Xylogone sp. PMI_703]
MKKTISIPNRALVVSGPNKLDIRPWPLSLEVLEGHPIVPDGNVLIRVRSSGICGSDIHFWKEGRAGPDIIKEPLVIGHEGAGEIVLVSSTTEKWKKGDRVGIKPSAPCLTCDDCTSGLSNICSNIRYSGAPPDHGSCCTLKIVPEAQLVRLTPRISWVEAGVLQPLAIAMQCSRQAGLKANQNVMIAGAGCIGLLLGAVAKAYGAAKVVVLEKQRHRVEFSKRYCSDYAFENPPYNQGEDTEAYSERVSQQILKGVPGLARGFDVYFDATGAEECMQIGIKLCRPGGTYVQVGIYDGPNPRISMMDVCSKQLNIRGSWRYTTNCFEDAVGMVDRGLIDLQRIISHVYRFDDGPQAFEAVYNQRDNTGKKLLKTVILLDDEKETSLKEERHLASLL